MINNEIRRIKLLLVDDHQMVRDGIRVMLESQNSIFSFEITEAENGEEALKKVWYNSYDIVLIDYQLPKMTGADTVKQVLLYSPNTKILALSNYDEVTYINNMLNAGVNGYILKNVEPAELIAAIKTVLDSKLYYSNEVALKLLESKKSMVVIEDKFGLTERETEILKMIAQEMSNDEIAKSLHLAKRTVDSHRQNLLRKLHAKNTVGLVKAAYLLKMI